MGLYEVLLSVATAAVAIVAAVFAMLGRHQGRTDPKDQIETHIQGAAIIDSRMAARWAVAAESLAAEASKQTAIHDRHAKAMEEMLEMMRHRDEIAARDEIRELRQQLQEQRREMDRLRNGR